MKLTKDQKQKLRDFLSSLPKAPPVKPEIVLSSKDENAGHSKEDERPLEDDYPVHYGFNYMADNKAVNSDISGTVKDLKKMTGAKVITKYRKI